MALAFHGRNIEHESAGIRRREEVKVTFGLFLLGVVAWGGVIALSIGMAIWDQPLWGFFPIAIAVVGAWAIGEYITDVVWKAGHR